jgi:hypothetical protein
MTARFCSLRACADNHFTLPIADCRSVADGAIARSHIPRLPDSQIADGPGPSN